MAICMTARQLAQAEKKRRRALREQQLGKKQRAMPAKHYGVIYADPPWRFEPYSRDTGMDRVADNHYPTMDLASIMALKVPAAADCVLFMWATVPMLPEALAVMSAWGFKYKTHFVWMKDKTGTGYWNRNNHEILLLGTRGSVPAPVSDKYPSAMPAQRTKHSAKPAVFRELIEQTFPTLPRIELFAREQHAGWDVWGNEVQEVAA